MTTYQKPHLVRLFLEGGAKAVEYAESRQYTEPLFVFVIMVVAASRPLLVAIEALIAWIAKLAPLPTPVAQVWLCLALVPLVGSLITEPAAMLAALMLAPLVFRAGMPEWLKYGALGVLFVNISIGGTLTSFAAPPVLMVATTWNWSSAFVQVAAPSRGALDEYRAFQERIRQVAERINGRFGTTDGPVIRLTLNGLEVELLAHLGAKLGKSKAGKLKINVVRYADDFIVTGASKEVLETEIRPWIEAFLAQRGLRLSPEKTRVTHIDEGFDFLGWNFRKYRGVLLIKPSRKNAKAFYD